MGPGSQFHASRINWVSWVVRWVDGVELARKKDRLLSILAAGSSHRPGWATCTLGGLNAQLHTVVVATARRLVARLPHTSTTATLHTAAPVVAAAATRALKARPPPRGA